MKTLRAFFISLFIVLNVVFLPLAALRGEGAYREPDLSKPVFDVTKCSLTPEERSYIATNLAVFVRNMPDAFPNRMDFAARALGIALMLDPENRSAAIANGQLSHGQKLSQASPATTPEITASGLQIKARDLKQKGGADNLMVAGYLLELAFAINPTNEDILYDEEMFKHSGAKVDWSFAGPPPSPSPAPQNVSQSAPSNSPQIAISSPAPQNGRPSYYPPLYVGPYVQGNTPPDPNGTNTPYTHRPYPNSANESPDTVPHFPLNTTADEGKSVAKAVVNQVAVKGILVRTLDNGREMAGAYQIIANVQPFASSECTMAQAVGKEMYIAFNEACRVLQNRYPAVQSGKQIMLSFQDKYSSKDGGSAGTAFTLLMLSIYNGMQFDPDVAVTGDITVNGKVGAVGAIPAKIRGALLDNCKVVSIPVSNKDDVADMALMYPPDTVWKIQILTANTIDDAINNTRADRPAHLAQAIQLFGKVQQFLSSAGATAYLNNAGVQKMLADVLVLAPNHLSASFMLEQASGRAPRNFSLNASLDELFIAAAPVLKANDGIYIQCDKGAYEAAQAKLGELQFKIDHNAEEVCNALIVFLKSKETWETMPGSRGRGLANQIEKDKAGLRTAVEKIKQDSETLELLRQKNG